MDIIFVRHGVPDFSLADERCMTQLEKDYAPLDRAYLSELHQKLTNAVFDDAQAIVHHIRERSKRRRSLTVVMDLNCLLNTI